MKKIKLAENLSEEEWLELRRRGIGGSDASIILGINKYRSIQELWLDKKGLGEKKAQGSEVTYWGHVLEDVVRKEFAKRSGLKVEIVPYLLQSEEYSFMQANLDGVVKDSYYGDCIFEAKTASAYKVEEWEEGIPKEYYAQVQHYMQVTDYKGAYVAVLIGGNQFRWKFVERDEEYISKLVQKEKEFWEYVENNVIPPIDGNEATKEYLEKCYPEAKSNSQIDLSSKENIELLNEYIKLKQDEKELCYRKTLLENMLKEQLQDNEEAKVGDCIIKWSNVFSTRFDSEEFKRNEPEMYEEYLKFNCYRKFSVKSK